MRSRRPSSSSETAPPRAPGEEHPTAGTLPYDLALPYASEDDGRFLPRVRVGVQFFAAQAVIVKASPLLDTGAELSIFDGAIAVQAGWSMEEVIRQALDVRRLYGLARRGPQVNAYMHDITCYVGLGARFAELRFRALLTPPNTLAFPVLGRAGFFEQVDVTFAEFEKMLYLRFRRCTLSHVARRDLWFDDRRRHHGDAQTPPRSHPPIVTTLPTQAS